MLDGDTQRTVDIKYLEFEQIELSFCTEPLF